MRVFIIDTRAMGRELQGGLVGVVGAASPTTAEKAECVAEVSRYVTDGWAVAADPLTPIGRLAALTAEAAGVPFVRFGSSRLPWVRVRTMVAERSPERDSADLDRSQSPALMPEFRHGGAGPADARIENGGR